MPDFNSLKERIREAIFPLANSIYLRFWDEHIRDCKILYGRHGYKVFASFEDSAHYMEFKNHVTITLQLRSIEAFLRNNNIKEIKFNHSDSYIDRPIDSIEYRHLAIKSFVRDRS